MQRKKELIGNSYPLSLVCRRVVISPVGEQIFLEAAHNTEIYSFWGHSNTIHAASERFGIDVTPRTERPSLSLSDEGFPVFNEIIFTRCWILSPRYPKGFRPESGKEISPEEIKGWQVLLMEWKSDQSSK